MSGGGRGFRRSPKGLNFLSSMLSSHVTWNSCPGMRITFEIPYATETLMAPVSRFLHKHRPATRSPGNVRPPTERG